MFLQIQTPKQFLVPFQVSVGFKQHKTSMDLVQRGHERVTKLLELLETPGLEKNKELVNNLVSLQDDLLTKKKGKESERRDSFFCCCSFRGIYGFGKISRVYNQRVGQKGPTIRRPTLLFCRKKQRSFGKKGYSEVFSNYISRKEPGQGTPQTRFYTRNNPLLQHSGGFF